MGAKPSLGGFGEEFFLNSPKCLYVVNFRAVIGVKLKIRWFGTVDA